MELDHFGNLFSCGYQLSIDERASLETQMVKKQQEEKLAGCVRAPGFAQPLARASHDNLTLPLPPPPHAPLPSFQRSILGARAGHHVRLPRGVRRADLERVPRAQVVLRDL